MRRPVLAMIFFLLSFNLLYAEEEKASDFILKYSDKIKGIIKKNIPLEKKKIEVKKVVDEILDYNELAKRSLGRHFKDRTPEELDKFYKLMRELIETSYLKKITNTADYKLVIKSESKEEGEVVVDTEISAKEGKVQVGFALLRRGDKWVIYDLIIDEVSTLSNYKSEFNKIIREQGFDMVIKKMENKLTELKDEK